MAIVREYDDKRPEKRSCLLVSDRAAKKLGVRERSWEDFDLGWVSNTGAQIRVYVLDEGESLQRNTSTYYGPGVVSCVASGGTVETVERHVNDPVAWQWIGRCIAEGHLSSTTILPPHDEKTVVKHTNGNSSRQ